MLKKQCTKCSFPKALVLFYKNGRGGRMSSCIVCTKQLAKNIRIEEKAKFHEKSL
jgi:hypothetical protein